MTLLPVLIPTSLKQKCRGKCFIIDCLIANYVFKTVEIVCKFCLRITMIFQLKNDIDGEHHLHTTLHSTLKLN